MDMKHSRILLRIVNNLCVIMIYFNYVNNLMRDKILGEHINYQSNQSNQFNLLGLYPSIF